MAERRIAERDGIADSDRHSFAVPAKYGTSPAVTAYVRKKTTPVTSLRAAELAQATLLLQRLALQSDESLVAPTATLLHRAATMESSRRPRHAAVALAGWDALTCTAEPLATPERRRALWLLSKALLGQIITTDQEMELLDTLDAAGLERVPPFEDSVVGELFRAYRGETLR